LPLAAQTPAVPASSSSNTTTVASGAGNPPAPNLLGLPPTISPDTKAQKLAGGFKFTEGATCAPNGDVYFVDQPNDRIMKWSVADGKLSVFLQPSGYSNGQYFDAHGNLISCADEKNELWSITPDGKHTVLVTNYQGKDLNGPNDVWVRPDGGMYLTDPFYRRTWWDHTDKQQDAEAVYYLTPDHKTLTRVDGDYVKPNGIVGTPDGKTLYVSDINGHKTWRYDIQPDGSLKNRTLICSLGSDGMTLDDHGNLYMSVSLRHAKGVTVVNTASGQTIGFIPLAEAPANMCFAGPDKQTLYICARTGFYCIKTNVKGANAAK
jgi:gluconolactonase